MSSCVFADKTADTDWHVHGPIAFKKTVQQLLGRRGSCRADKYLVNSAGCHTGSRTAHALLQMLWDVDCESRENQSTLKQNCQTESVLEQSGLYDRVAISVESIIVVLLIDDREVKMRLQ